MFTHMLKIDRTTRTLLKDPHKRRGWIIYQLTLQGRSLASVARKAGVRRQTLYQVFLKPYPRMEKVLADALAMTPQHLFPERYDADGLPVRRMGRPRKVSCHGSKHTTQTTRRNVKKREAA